jgi:hypothetical protein
MKAKAWPAVHWWLVRTALGIEIWNLLDSFAVADIAHAFLSKT